MPRAPGSALHGPRGGAGAAAPLLWTIGHSTRPVEALVAVLEAHAIECVADVRRFPGSRRLPQFAAEALEGSLAARGIAYRWLPALGGRRRAEASGVRAPSAWRHAAFRAYAEHLATEEFGEGLAELLTIAHGLRTAAMCAEVLWWRCHRRLIADAVLSLGLPVAHIRDAGAATAHRLAPPARLVRGRLTYEPGDLDGG